RGREARARDPHRRGRSRCWLTGRGTVQVTMRDPIPISNSLEGVVRSLRGPSRSAVSGVFGRWDEAVGAQIAAHVRPIKLDEGVLLVEVDDPAWATQLRFIAP